METLRKYISKVKVPRQNDKVYKDECIYSYDSPESSSGLYVCLNTFLGIGQEYLKEYCEKTDNHLFLHMQRKKEPIPVNESEVCEPEEKIVRLAIGVDGGFPVNRKNKGFVTTDSFNIFCYPDSINIPLESDGVPTEIVESIEGILKAVGAFQKAEMESNFVVWDGEVKIQTKHVDLKQLDNGIKIPPTGWKCAMCDKTDNLWLNLTDGMILCGRRQLDGSGGNNHGVEYYQETGYPLAVKLGTITRDGQADVYSYDEDDMVIDTNLVKHLTHFGINISQMEKTEKTMNELDIELNQRAWEWSRVCESKQKLSPLFGSGHTGMKNLGNSCYMNSVMQVLLSIPSFIEKYYNQRKNILKDVAASDSPQNLNVQISKLAHGLLSGRYSKTPQNFNPQDNHEVDIDELQPGISPNMFKYLVGKGHAEFATKRQQDSMEYLQYIIEQIQRNSRGAFNPCDVFKFKVEEKFLCKTTNKVRYQHRNEFYFPLPVPLEAATNKEQVQEYEKRQKEKREGKINSFSDDEVVHPKVPFQACLSRFVNSEEITAFSSAVGKSVQMERTTRFNSFPDYLIIQLVKFGLKENWEPVKYDVSIDMPDELDLSILKGYGKQEGEELLPDSTSTHPESEVTIDDAVVNQLMDMGFGRDACRKAVILTGNSGSESALNWIMEHANDPDFNSPYQAPESTSSSYSVSKFVPNEEGLGILMSMGFSKDQATFALKETSNNLERAADWIFSHEADLTTLMATSSNTEVSKDASASDYSSLVNGIPKYELFAFITHMGTSVYVGHYVCHIKKNEKWVFYNDNKVLESTNPPKDLGYIYFYKRRDC